MYISEPETIMTQPQSFIRTAECCTCSEAIGEDATAVFNMLSGYSEPLSWNKLVVAPIWLRKKFIKLIQRETKNARAGKKARIVAKMNSLCDQEIIAALYEASAAGVTIDLIVRGICCLRVGIPKVSENIRVRSIVGNFLEHSRIFYFYNDGQEEIYMGSADWMPRNLLIVVWRSFSRWKTRT